MLRILWVALACTSSIQAQPSFEAASVKIAAPTTQTGGVFRGGRGTSSPGQWSGTNITVRGMLLRAWNLQSTPYLLVGPPSLTSEHYDIAAKVPSGTSPENFRLMIQNLLADRLGLVLHHEMREQTVEDLLVAKGGVKMKPAEGGPAPAAADQSTVLHLGPDKDGNPTVPPGKPMVLVKNTDGITRMTTRMQSLADIGNLIQGQLGHPVIDKTGITGTYDFILEFENENLAPRPGGDANPSGTEPKLPVAYFREALVRQLGLRLESRRVPWDTLIVDSFNKVPKEN